VYQVNLSRAWSVQLDAAVPPAALYRRLRASNPAPFGASLVISDLAILSSSPERLFSVRHGPFGPEIETRPIAGTRPRSRINGADSAERAGLSAHPKERAEHLMLVDLERNDLGKICVPGSVCVEDLMAVESYAHVHHLVSSVRGRLRKEVTPAGVLGAVFPGGTITGCPKIRCMEIIAQLEGVGRGAYTGSLGYINRDGSADFNILIRTLTHCPSTGEVSFRAGAGIVADSDPERELEETRAKARGLLKALGAAE
jgi:anthranilate synthase component 1